jgi:F0F1-type ATP synthase assembly protein I
MRNNKTSNYGIAFLSVIIFGVIGLFTLGFNNGVPLGLIVGVIVGLLVSILIALERIFSILDDKTQSKNEN